MQNTSKGLESSRHLCARTPSWWIFNRLGYETDMELVCSTKTGAGLDRFRHKISVSQLCL